MAVTKEELIRKVEIAIEDCDYSIERYEEQLAQLSLLCAELKAEKLDNKILLEKLIAL